MTDNRRVDDKLPAGWRETPDGLINQSIRAVLTPAPYSNNWHVVIYRTGGRIAHDCYVGAKYENGRLTQTARRHAIAVAEAWQH
jgi:hypothetical protein